MRERATFLGSDSRMTGIITSPDDAQPYAGLPAILLLNAGLIHHVGPNRMYVDLARRLVKHGFTSIRFDMTGIGDSDRADMELPYVEQTVADIREAMDGLEEELGVHRFVLMGLCTGAYSALAAAPEDTRVSGIALIDGYAYPTRRYIVKDWTWKLSQGWRWRRYLERRLRMGSSSTTPGQPDAALVFQPEQLDSSGFEERISLLADRGTRVHISYTRYGPQPYNYERQLFDRFPALERDTISLLYLPDANHTFTLSAPRSELIESLCTWMENGFHAGRLDGAGA